MNWIIIIGITGLSSLFFTPKDTAPPAWVQAIIAEQPKFTTITQCHSEGQDYWKINHCTQCHDMITKVYDANQNLVCQYGGIARKNTCLEKEIYWEDCEVIYGKQYQMGIGL